MHTWLILAGVLIFLWFWFSSRKAATTQRGILSFGKSRAKEAVEEEVSFADVAGVDEAQEELQEVVDFLTHSDRYVALGARIPKGVLLVGPPGTGKTLLARAVAGEAKVPFYHLSGSEFVEMFVGVGASRVRDLFDKARQSAPCIVFIDELDAIGRARGSGPLSHEEREQTLNQLLVELDGFDPSTGVILMAATNRPEILDQALLRPGRFDRQILVDRPDKDGRQKILEIHSKEVTLDPSVDLENIAGRTQGFAGADLANLVNESALLAARRRKSSVTQEEFDEAYERVMMGLEKKGRMVSPEERRIVAFHELGHAVVSEILPGADPVQKISIVPRGIAALGLTWQRQTEDRFLQTATELKHAIAVALGGRAAEIFFIGEPSTGAQNDLARATDVASDMVRKYGMSPLGQRTFERTRTAMVNADLTAANPRDHGDATAMTIDREVDHLMEEGLKTATAILEEHQELIRSLAEELLEKQQISGKDLRRALGLPEPEPAPPTEPKPESEPDPEPTEDTLVAPTEDSEPRPQ